MNARPVNTREARIDGLRTAWIEAGTPGAAPVLLLHGGGIDRAARSWAETIPALAPRHAVLAPDLPGYGGTEGFGAPHGIERLGGWLLAFLDHVAAPRPIAVVGNSMGGAMALWLALGHPGRVSALAPVGSYGLARRAPAHPALYAWARLPAGRQIALRAARHDWAARAALSAIFARPSRITGALVAEMREEAALQADRQTFRDFLAHEVLPTRYRTWFGPDLPRLAQPALFVHGRADRLIAARHARAAASAAPRGRSVVLDAGHWPMRERPRDFLEALVPFLSAHA